jgi:CheY-like chemotaxis protein
VLLVEDNAINRQVATMMLEKMGCHVESAGDGEEALRRLARGGHDAVLMDCQMPGLDGYETTRRIRAGAVPGVNPTVPVIALTAYAMPGDREKCHAAGMNDYLTKPLRMAELGRTLGRHGLTGAKPFAAEVPGPVEPADAVLSPAQQAQLAALPGRDHATLLEELVVLFLQEAPGRLAALRRQQAAGDAAALRQEAHRLAGSCASLGAEPMRRAALALEQAAAAGADLAAPLAALEAEWHRLRLALVGLSGRVPP